VRSNRTWVSINYGTVAQLVEQRTENPCVGGSIPSSTTPWKDKPIGGGHGFENRSELTTRGGSTPSPSAINTSV
jgi:hypothetical protein